MEMDRLQPMLRHCHARAGEQGAQCLPIMSESIDGERMIDQEAIEWHLAMKIPVCVICGTQDLDFDLSMLADIHLNDHYYLHGKSYWADFYVLTMCCSCSKQGWHWTICNRCYAKFIDTLPSREKCPSCGNKTAAFSGR
jgi:hypothetical protein